MLQRVTRPDSVPTPSPPRPHPVPTPAPPAHRTLTRVAFRAAHGGGNVQGLLTLLPMRLSPLARSISAFALLGGAACATVAARARAPRVGAASVHGASIAYELRGDP